MESPLLKDIPGYEAAIRKARQRETFIRLAPFLSKDLRVCGIPILALTLGHYLLLNLVGSPLLLTPAAGAPDTAVVDDIILFLWFVSPDYLPTGPTVTRAQSKKARVTWLARYRARLLRSLGRPGGVARVAKRLREQVDEALYDCPSSSSDSPNAHAVLFAASILDEFAFEYGWTRAEIFATPLSILMQARRAATIRQKPGAVLSSRSDRAGITVIRRHNARKKRQAARRKRK